MTRTFGARKNAIVFDEYFYKFWENIFFPHLKANRINTILHLGDLVDSRKEMNYGILANFKRRFVGVLEKEDVSMYVLPGNHDCHLKNTNEINAVDLIFSNFPKISYVEEACIKTFDEREISFLPWITADNYNEAMQFISQPKTSVLMGHLELSGFEMDAGNVAKHGMNPTLFDGYKRVLSGHYHQPSDNGHIKYLGAQYEMSWADYGCTRGFSVFDTKDESITFVKNPYTIHEKLVYDENKEQPQDLSHLAGKFVKVLVVDRKDHKKYDRFMGLLHAQNPYDVQVLDSDFGEIDVDENGEIVVEDTLMTLNNYVDATTLTTVDPSDIKATLRELYMESVTSADVQ